MVIHHYPRAAYEWAVVKAKTCSLTACSTLQVSNWLLPVVQLQVHNFKPVTSQTLEVGFQLFRKS